MIHLHLSIVVDNVRERENHNFEFGTGTIGPVLYYSSPRSLKVISWELMMNESSM